jgi:hypothetical protein
MSDLNTLIIYSLASISILLGLLFLKLKLKIFFKEQKAKLRLKRGIDKENKAASVLLKKGYKIISHHKKHHYNLISGNKKHKIEFETDYEVIKNGKHYIVEVKSGNSAPSIHNSSTRRQILEYYLFAPNNGILLLNMETENITKITFPKHIKNHSLHKNTLYITITLSIITLASLIYYIHYKTLNHSHKHTPNTQTIQNPPKP